MSRQYKLDKIQVLAAEIQELHFERTEMIRCPSNIGRLSDIRKWVRHKANIQAELFEQAEKSELGELVKLFRYKYNGIPSRSTTDECE